MKTLFRTVALLAVLMPGLAVAADKAPTRPVNPDDSYATAKAAQIETMRVRMGARPSPNATTTLLELDDLLRRYKAAPAAQKSSLRSQLDAAATRLELELMSTQ